jgi:hypothetical protein
MCARGLRRGRGRDAVEDARAHPQKDGAIVLVLVIVSVSAAASIVLYRRRVISQSTLFLLVRGIKDCQGIVVLVLFIVLVPVVTERPTLARPPPSSIAHSVIARACAQACADPRTRRSLRSSLSSFALDA